MANRGRPKLSSREIKVRDLQIYEQVMRRRRQEAIAADVGVDARTVRNAIKRCQANRLDLNKPEDLQIFIDAKEGRINWIYERIDFLKSGVEWEEEESGENHLGSYSKRKRGLKIYPGAEARLLKELRELENDILELKGLLAYAEQQAGSGGDKEDDEHLDKALDAIDAI